ncbi:thioesterase II family protein [Actinoplanes sp. NPDC049265]|uniref:thioesterase II family protein n=1 Tax=Actinoplanes sp. NPDC049265 TaxID=3363902 RepID=UPI003713C36C
MTNLSGPAVAAGLNQPAWIVRPRPRPRAGLTLICLHAAASGAMMFRRWPNLLPEDIDVALVRMPGRESRLSEPVLRDFGAAVDALVTVIDSCADRPYALLGHSMGAHLAFAVAGARIAAGMRPPRRLFLSGTRPPHLFRPSFTPGASDDELIDWLARIGGTDLDLLRNEEIRAIVLPALRADLSICSGVRPTGPALPCRMSVFGGEQDDIPRGDLEQWHRWSELPVTTTMFTGRHFFLTAESERDVVREVVRILGEP